MSSAAVVIGALRVSINIFYLRNRFLLIVICCSIYRWLEVSREVDKSQNDVTLVRAVICCRIIHCIFPLPLLARPVRIQFHIHNVYVKVKNSIRYQRWSERMLRVYLGQFQKMIS